MSLPADETIATIWVVSATSAPPHQALPSDLTWFTDRDAALAHLATLPGHPTLWHRVLSTFTISGPWQRDHTTT